MKFTKLRLKNFGKFIDYNVELTEGINLISGDNEAGKSTLHSFITGMLFGIERQRGRASKEDVYIKYKPWETPSIYGGTLSVEYKGKEYCIYRNFHKENKEYKVIDLMTGREVLAPDIKGVSFIEGLTKENYKNTISVGQLKSKTEKELAMDVSNHMANLSLSKSNQVDIGKAINHLTNKRKKIEKNQTKDKIKALEEEIESSMLDDIRMEKLSSSIKELEEELAALEESSQKDETRELYDYIQAYPGITEKFNQLQRLLKEKENYENLLADYENIGKGYIIDGKRKILYFIVTILMIVGIIYIKGMNPLSIFIMLFGVLLTLGISYMINKRERENNSDKRDLDKDRIYHSMKEITSLAKREEKYILNYGTRIWEMTQVNSTSMNRLEEEIHGLKNRVDTLIRENNEKMEEIKIQLERLRWELDIHEEKELSVHEKMEMQEELKKKHMEEEKEQKAISLGINTINQLSSNIHDDFGQKLNSMVSYIISQETDGKYDNIKVDEKLNMKAGHKEDFIELDRLSVGTIEQFYLALRLSVAKLIFSDEKMPLLLDDAFAYYDDRRLKGMLNILTKEKDRQIIIFTCQGREERLLKELKIPFHQIVLK